MTQIKIVISICGFIFGIFLGGVIIWYVKVCKVAKIYNGTWEIQGIEGLKRQYLGNSLEDIFPDMINEELLEELHNNEAYDGVVAFSKQLVPRIFAYRHWDRNEPWPDWIKPEDRKVNWLYLDDWR